MKEKNVKIRQALRSYSIPIWQLADAYGKAESTMYRLFRHELPEAEQEKMIRLIEEIVKERSR